MVNRIVAAQMVWDRLRAKTFKGALNGRLVKRIGLSRDT